MTITVGQDHISKSPEMWTVWYESPPLPFHVPKDAPCHRQTIDSLQVSEQHHDNADFPYGIRFEAVVRSQPELASAQTAASHLERQLVRVWPYIAGVPLYIRQNRMQIAFDGPLGWRTNGAALRKSIPGVHMEVTLGPVEREFGPTLSAMPLVAALHAIPSLEEADALTAALIDLHHRTWWYYMQGAELFLLAKTLELALALLPGRTYTAKERALPKEYRDSLVRSVPWLQMIANTRLDLRHAVKRSRDALELHPLVTMEERRDFLNDGDRVVRAVISLRLGIEVCTIVRDK